MTNNPNNKMAAANNLDDRFIDDNDSAERLGVSVKTLRRWRLLGRGPRWYKLGRAVRYSVADLRSWLAAQPTGGGH